MAVFGKRYHPPGTAPGTLKARTGPTRPVLITICDYDADSFDEHAGLSLDECREYFFSDKVTWLHVQGDASPRLLHALGEAYRLHPLAMEDVINTGQRTKLDIYAAHLFTVMSLPVRTEAGMRVEQISLFLGAGFLVSVHEGDRDIFGPVRERLRNGAARRIRQRQTDYLFYALLDVVVDEAFPVIEAIGDELAAVEQEVFGQPTRRSLDRIYGLKRELVLIRRVQWPQREVLNQLVRDDSRFIEEDTRTYLRDCYDHTIQVMDLTESFRETSSSLMEVYLSSISNRMNEIMKVLTMIATIFIPLSFLVGIYGMNFNTDSPWNMPELNSRYGYPMVWLVIICVVIGMLVFFRKRDWL
ncbi:MAG: magnesium/cobalt transporter CorA [Gammaproteobacteria bacterium]|nr:magnesium/cobalt transporter CorA [Gammaproteobacteria bacterium]